jgi:hypothetical protein
MEEVREVITEIITDEKRRWKEGYNGWKNWKGGYHGWKNWKGFYNA